MGWVIYTLLGARFETMIETPSDGLLLILLLDNRKYLNILDGMDSHQWEIQTM